MSETKMPRGHAIATHLSFGPAVDGLQRLSSFAAVLRDARAVTGRSRETGEMIDPSLAGSWLGALGYLILLEQIGECFRPVGRQPLSGPKTVIALQLFADVTEARAEALYALRNAFAHDFGLCNPSSNPQRQHHFAVCADPLASLVELPQAPWDGDYDNRTLLNRTQVNLWALAEVAEEVVHHLVELANVNALEVVLPGGSDELLQRYSMMFRNRPRVD